jgi:hypothetical protein
MQRSKMRQFLDHPPIFALCTLGLVQTQVTNQAR